MPSVQRHPIVPFSPQRPYSTSPIAPDVFVTVSRYRLVQIAVYAAQPLPMRHRLASPGACIVPRVDAIDDPNPEVTKEIGKGLEKGAQLSNISIIGGETASLPEIVNGFDLAGTCLAYVKRDEIVTGESISPGDVIIGIASSGIHSNGYTLVRKIIENNDLSYTDMFPDGFYPGKTIGEVLLTPTQIYVKEIVALLKKVNVHGLAHITGGGLRNLPRLNKKVNFIIEDPFEPQPIFTFLQKYGDVDDKEMYQTFNMGMGFAVIVAKKDVDKTLKTLKKHSKSEVKVVGRIEKGMGVEAPDLKIKF